VTPSKVFDVRTALCLHYLQSSLNLLAAKPPATRPREPQTTRYGRTLKSTRQSVETEVKKPRKTQNTTIKKKAEQTDMVEPVRECMARTVTSATEAASASTSSRPRKPLPARARATPKPKNAKQPNASTSSSAGRRPRQSAAARTKVTKTPRDGHPQPSTSSDLPPSIASPADETTETPQPSASFTTCRQTPEVRSEPKMRASPSRATVVESGALQALPSELQRSMTSGRKFEGPTEPQVSTSSAVHSHVSQLVTQPLQSTSSITDAQLYEFITWPGQAAASNTDGQARREISQHPTPVSNDYKGGNGALPEMNFRQSQSSASHPLKTEAVEDLPEWNKSPQESMTIIGTTSASDVLVGSQGTPGGSTARDADHQHSSLLRISPLTALLKDVTLSEVAYRGETSPSPNASLVASAVSTPAEGASENLSLAPTPASLEEGQTPDTSTLVGYDSDATDATVSTLVTSHAPTPKIKFQRLMSSRRTSRPRTAEPINDQSSQRLTIKLPAQSLACDDTPSTAESMMSAQSRLPVASTPQPVRRSLRMRHLAVQISADTSSSSSSVLTESANHELSPLSPLGATTFPPEPEPRVSKKRKLGRAT
jgi:hypothetical protein